MSAAEWEKIKKESGIVESNGEAHRIQEDEEPEPISTPTKKYPQVGQMQAAKGGKPAGEVTEWKSHEGYDAQAESFAGKHPTLAKAVDIGKKAVGVVNKKSAEYIKNVQKSDEKFKEMEGEREEEPEEKSSKKKSSKKKSKGKMLDEDDFDFDDEDADITALHKSTSKQKVLPGDYKSAYGGGMGKKGYEPVYTAGIGMGTTYQPAYKPKVGESPEALTDITQISRTRGKKSAIEELTPREPAPQSKEPDRFNMQNWQSLGFPNTLPQAARGALLRPAPQQPQQVVPMVRQPYQPRAQMPMPRIGAGLFTTPTIATPRGRIPTIMGLKNTNIPRIGMGSNLPRVATPAIKRTQTTAQVPRMGGNLFTNLPQIMKPQQKVANTNAAPAQITMFSVPMKKKNK